MSREFEELEQRGATEQEIVEFGTGRLRMAVLEGDVTYGSVMAGQISGLVHDIMPAAELIRRTMAEAEALWRAWARWSGVQEPCDGMTVELSRWSFPARAASSWAWAPISIDRYPEARAVYEVPTTCWAISSRSSALRVPRPS